MGIVWTFGFLAAFAEDDHAGLGGVAGGAAAVAVLPLAAAAVEVMLAA